MGRLGTLIFLFVAAVTAALAQAEPGKPKIAQVGMLSDSESFGNPISPLDWLAAFRSGLRDAGYREGENIRFEYRNADHDMQKLARQAAELVALKPDVIVASSTTAAKAAKAATHTIPIVFWGAEPVSSGLVHNLDHPGENLTGVTANEEQQKEFLGQLKEIVPALDRVAILFNPSYGPVPGLLKYAEEGARALRLTPLRMQVTAPEDIPGAFAEMKRAACRAVLVLNHGMFFRERSRLAELAIANEIGMSTPYLPNAEAGALIAHEADFDRVWRMNAAYVDKILKGANPGDLPIQRASFRYAVNVNTANALGLTIPPSILQQAVALGAGSSEPASAVPDSAMLPVKHIHANGTELAYVEKGSGEPVVLVHGLISDYRAWEKQIDELGRQYHIIAYSRRYHYPNAWVGDGSDYSVDLHVRDLAALIQALGVGPVHLIGHSYGGRVATLVAISHPELVRTLVVAETGFVSLLKPRPEWKEVVAEQKSQYESASRAERVGGPERALRAFFETSRTPDFFDRLPAADRQRLLDNARTLLPARREDIAEEDFTCADVQRLQAPVMWVQSELGARVMHLIGDELIKCQPRIERVTIPNARHAMMRDNPAAFNQAVLAFLQKHSLCATETPKGDFEEAKQQILEREEERHQAILHNDAAAMDRLLAEDFVVTDNEGRTHDRADELSLYKNGRRQTQSWDASDVKVHVYNGDAGVVTERVTVKDVLDGKPRQVVFRLTDVWIRSGGTWKVVARHGTRIAEPETTARVSAKERTCEQPAGEQEHNSKSEAQPRQVTEAFNAAERSVRWPRRIPEWSRNSNNWVTSCFPVISARTANASNAEQSSQTSAQSSNAIFAALDASRGTGVCWVKTSLLEDSPLPKRCRAHPEPIQESRTSQIHPAKNS